MCGLKICTLRFAIWARRSRRISSSLLPLNMLPATTSIHPAPVLCCATTSNSDLLLVLAVLRADTDHVADVHMRRHLHDQAGLERRGLHLRARGGAIDPRRRVHYLQVHGDRQLDADRLVAVE